MVPDSQGEAFVCMNKCLVRATIGRKSAEVGQTPMWHLTRISVAWRCVALPCCDVIDDVATCAQVGFLEPGDRVVVLETVLDDSHSPRHRTNKGWARHRPPHATDWHWSHRIEPLP